MPGKTVYLSKSIFSLLDDAGMDLEGLEELLRQALKRPAAVFDIFERMFDYIRENDERAATKAYNILTAREKEIIDGFFEAKEA